MRITIGMHRKSRLLSITQIQLFPAGSFLGLFHGHFTINMRGLPQPHLIKRKRGRKKERKKERDTTWLRQTGLLTWF